MIFITFLMIMLSIIIAFNSTSMFIYWLALEMNMYFFIPIMNKSMMKDSLKYFLVQAMGSILFLFSLIMLKSMTIYIYILILSLLLKMGMTPFLFWLIDICFNLEWMSFLVLLTIQKILPFIILFTFMDLEMYGFYLLMLIIINILISGLGGINQHNVKILLSYSSVSHLSWMFLACAYSFNLWVFYYIIYIMLFTMLMFTLKLMMTFKMPLIFHYKDFKYSLLIFILLSALGGMPPFLGFMAKLMVIQVMLEQKYYLIMIIMSLMTLLVIFFYLSLFMESALKQTLFKSMLRKLDLTLYFSVLVLIMFSLLYFV
uniref:NADH-ubiquinone oxidoreductase chain 2 n=1 Tax=Arisubathynella cheongmiensis TaxID=2025387 RepID=A0A7R6D7G0_9CRUS|nr:NADH dehydrogenase subunit 2 [Arisubathynella cheongmiensis]